VIGAAGGNAFATGGNAFAIGWLDVWGQPIRRLCCIGLNRTGFSGGS